MYDSVTLSYSARPRAARPAIGAGSGGKRFKCDGQVVLLPLPQEKGQSGGLRYLLVRIMFL